MLDRKHKRYTHDVTTIGWELHDDKPYAFPRSKVTISPPTDEYVVSVNTVLPGKTQQPLAKQPRLRTYKGRSVSW